VESRAINHRVQYCPLSAHALRFVLVQQLGREQCVRGETGEMTKRPWVIQLAAPQFRIDPVCGPAGGHVTAVDEVLVTGLRAELVFLKRANFKRANYFWPRSLDARFPGPARHESSSSESTERVCNCYRTPYFQRAPATTDESIPDLHQWSHSPTIQT